ncbi:MAG TPA: type I phosphomannose isomerase catalytic subunit [Candidatus Acidoferrum sp.]
MRPQPIRIEPQFLPRIWGSRTLAPIYRDKTNLREPIGEAWLTGPQNEIAEGPLKGTLESAWNNMSAEWRGSSFSPPQSGNSKFPILVKFLFPAARLSIQVHPGDEFAARNEAPGESGKTEMWHAVSAEPGATLLLGLVPEISQERFTSSAKNGGLETFLQRLPVYPGDTFFVAPGTPHTIGPGMILCEVQQNSDLTYRLYDYDRRDSKGKPRQLHIEKAMAVIDFHNRRGGKVASLTLSSSDGIKKMLLAACPYFAAERWDLSTPYPGKSDPERFELLTILNGRGSLDYSGGGVALQQGECWFLPANLGQFSLRPEGDILLLRSFVPKLGQLRDELAKSGTSRSAIDKVLFN